jgi:hypothetical protein
LIILGSTPEIVGTVFGEMHAQRWDQPFFPCAPATRSGRIAGTVSFQPLGTIPVTPAEQVEVPL